MGSPQTIDIDALLAPISETAPTGTNVREGQSQTLYMNLRDNARNGRRAERRADEAGEPPPQLQEWRNVRASALDILATRSKDLEVAAWLIEALVRTNFFPGLRDGFKLTRGLVERYWDILFSQGDEGIAAKVNPLAGLNGVEGEGILIQAIRKIPVTKGDSDGPFAAYHYVKALELPPVNMDDEEKAKQELERLKERGTVTLKRFQTEVTTSGGKYYVAMLADIEECIAEFDALSKILDERAGYDAPPTTNIRSALTDTLDIVKRFSKELVDRERPAVTAEQTSPDGEAAAQGNGSEGAIAMASGPIRSRADALGQLRQVAEFFQRYEPHSPISESLRDIVRRADLSFTELLRELVSDPMAWRSALEKAGIKPPGETT